jgi:hypothetical protein
MGRELNILPSSPSGQPTEPEQEKVIYSRVFCSRDNSPPLKLLLDFLKSKGQIPLVPKMDPAALDEWAWVHISLGYHRERKPIQVVCLRDQGTYKSDFDKEKSQFLHMLSIYDDEEGQVVQACVRQARFIVSTRMVETDMTEEGYDFNGWILEFFQENCTGIVQVDGKGFFSPKGDLVIDMEFFDSPEI